MELLRCKIRLAAIWLTMAVGTLSSMFLYLLKPKGIETVMAGQWGDMELNEGALVIFSLFFMIPMIAAILCLTINRSANKWMNFILGIIWVLWFIFEIVSHATTSEVVTIANWLITAGGTIFSVIIVYLAWKLPKQEA